MVRPSPLLNAIHRRRSSEHVRLLLDAGADPNVKFADGTSAYVAALRFGLTQIAEMLRAAGVFEQLYAVVFDFAEYGKQWFSEEVTEALLSKSQSPRLAQD
jgi:ankyrin repeat protein